jgi:hypothetical protein
LAYQSPDRITPSGLFLCATPEARSRKIGINFRIPLEAEFISGMISPSNTAARAERWRADTVNPIEKAIAADEAWQAEINRTLKGVENARYLPAGKGEEGSELRRLYEIKRAASEEMHAYFRSRIAA